MRHRTRYLFIAFLAFLLALAMLSVTACNRQPGNTQLEPDVVIGECSVVLEHTGVDTLDLNQTNVVLTNQGGASATISRIVLSFGNSVIECAIVDSLDPGGTRDYSLSAYWTSDQLEKAIGVEQVMGTLTVFDSSGEALATKDIAIPIPAVDIGDTIPDFATEVGKNSLSLTLISWSESMIAVEGPYVGDEYYTFTAKPGMKFIDLIFEMKNNWTRVQETPYLDAGEVATDKGYIYEVWHSPLGIDSEEYKPRVATAQEIQLLLGDTAAYEDLMQEQSVRGRVVFEIAEDETPIEASIAYIPGLVRFS
jgi:hypothetical protein